MRVLCQGVRSGRFSPQVNASSTTAASGAYGALSRSSNVASSCRPGTRTATRASAGRPMTLANGSISSLCGLNDARTAAGMGRGRGSRRAGPGGCRADSHARPCRSVPAREWSAIRLLRRANRRGRARLASRVRKTARSSLRPRPSGAERIGRSGQTLRLFLGTGRFRGTDERDRQATQAGFVPR